MGPKLQEQVVMKPKGKKLSQEKKKTATAVEKQLLPTKSADPVDPQEHLSSTWSPKKVPKAKMINRDNSPSTILNAIQRQKFAPGEWEELADQVLTRGLQKNS